MSYRDLAEHAVALFGAATDEQLAAPVRWTPRWSARDVLAHLVDTAERAVAGEEGPPADEQAHSAVLARRGATVTELTGRLAELAPQVKVAEFGPSQAWDIAVHLADVRETWGSDPLPEPLWRPVLDGAVAFLAAVGHDPGPGADDAYERFRELFSRRDVPGAFFS